MEKTFSEAQQAGAAQRASELRAIATEAAALADVFDKIAVDGVFDLTPELADQMISLGDKMDALLAVLGRALSIALADQLARSIGFKGVTEEGEVIAESADQQS